MTTLYNPLFKNQELGFFNPKPVSKDTATPVNLGNVKVSPFSGKPLVSTILGGSTTPVMVDFENRVVYPVFDA
jgi:hypothetical protein